MKNQEDLSERLVEETVAEMAETFFGRRREIEHLKDDIDRLVPQVRLAFDVATANAALFQHLMPDDESAREALRAVGVDPEPILAAAASAACEAALPKTPFALTDKGRWIKLALLAYEELSHAVETYAEGSYIDDPGRPGRKLLTPHLSQIEHMAKKFNVLVEKANTYETPSAVLGFMRGLDPAEMDKQRITGATLDGWAQSIDEKLSFEPIDIASFGLPRLPGLPRTEESARALRGALEHIYSTKKERAAEILRRVKERT